MKCLIRRVAKNRFTALCLEIGVEVVANSEDIAFHALLAALVDEAKKDIIARGVRPLRGLFAPVPAEIRREFKKARACDVSESVGKWDIRFVDCSASPAAPLAKPASKDVKILRKVEKSIKKRSAQKRKKGVS